VSIGVAALPESGDSPQTVLKAADEALYRAKEGGRNRIELSTSTYTNSSGSIQQSVVASPALARFYSPDKETDERLTASLVDGS
jgi:predicted signal transduction protein with EAL and GGDEF domain